MVLDKDSDKVLKNHLCHFDALLYDKAALFRLRVIADIFNISKFLPDLKAHYKKLKNLFASYMYCKGLFLWHI